MSRSHLLKYILAYGLVFVLNSVRGQSSNSYGLEMITTLEQYRQSVEEDSTNQLVRLLDFAPSLILDIKYSTAANVFYTQLYPRPIALARLPVAKALAKAQEDFEQQGLSLKIYDAYRPYAVTVEMYEILPDTVYMGLPWQGSRHNRGVALDLTLVDLSTGKELKMPTPFDALVYASHPEFTKLPAQTIANRELLKKIMKKHGFMVDPVEWWHYNYLGKKSFGLLDIPIDAMDEEVLKKKSMSSE